MEYSRLGAPSQSTQKASMMIHNTIANAAFLQLTSPLLANLSSLNSFLNGLYVSFPRSIQSATLLLLRVGVGLLFMLHGYPKITHLKQWSKGVKMPIALCFLSALSMLLGGFCLIIGLLTPFASTAILGSMVFAMVLEIIKGSPFVARDPYQIPSGQYEGPRGKGEPPSWEKTFMYCLMLVTIAVFGPGAFSLDASLVG
jgi:putative oxidoreductase